MYFELATLTFAAVVFLLLWRTDKHIVRSYIFTFVGVFLFEYFTHPLWINMVEPWAYLPFPKSTQLDISWVITLAWTTLILLSIKIVDSLYPKAEERTRFIGYILLVTGFGLVAEYFVRFIGVREYDAAVYEVLTGKMIGGLLPIEAFYYIPVFMTLVVSFSRYWSISSLQLGNQAPKKPAKATGRKRRK